MSNEIALWGETREGVVGRASKRCDKDRTCRKRWRAKVDDHPHWPQGIVSETITEDAQGVHRAAGVRFKLEVPRHNQARVPGGGGDLLPSIPAPEIRRNRVLCDQLCRSGKGRR